MERLLVSSLLSQAKADLPDGFNSAAIDGMEPLDQVEFLHRFKAAFPKIAAAPAVAAPATKPAPKAAPGATIPAKPTSVSSVEPGSMSERARLARQTLDERRKAGDKSGVMTGPGFYQ